MRGDLREISVFVLDKLRQMYGGASRRLWFEISRRGPKTWLGAEVGRGGREAPLIIRLGRTCLLGPENCHRLRGEMTRVGSGIDVGMDDACFYRLGSNGDMRRVPRFSPLELVFGRLDSG